MHVEIERKFLIAGDAWRNSVRKQCYLKQGYIAAGDGCTVRVRIADTRGFLTLKAHTCKAVRSEFEYEIPRSDADFMLESFCRKPLVEKNRYWVDHAGFTWEIDEFLGENQGLIFAEIELPREDTFFERPAWVFREVTHLSRYYNSNLGSHPYSTWTDAEKEALDGTMPV